MYSLLFLAVVSFTISLLLTPFVRNLFKRFHIVDHPDDFRKLHPDPIPRVGGIALAISYAVSLGALGLSSLTVGQWIRDYLTAGLLLAPAIVLVFAVGLLDDLKNIRPRYKLAGQFVAALLAYFVGGVHVTNVLGYALPDILSVGITVFFLLACTNAFNLIDGVDGLAAGVGLFAALTTLLAALQVHNYALAVLIVPLVGALAGFLRYNFNPATIFLGDSGSLLIGFLLGCYGILWSQKSATMLGMTAPLMAMAIPLLDTALAIARRFLRQQPIFAGDRGHIHHQLLNRGMTPRRVALILYGVAGIFATFSLLMSLAREQFTGLILVLFAAVTWVGIQHLGYTEFGTASRMVRAGSFRRLLNSQLALNGFEEELKSAGTDEEIWSVLETEFRNFGFVRVDLHIHGRHFSAVGPEAPATNDCWHLRVPLSPTDYVLFQRPHNCDVNTTMVVPFADVVRKTLQERTLLFSRSVSAAV
jgi:UDP-GlcNAc:undecaprenyl-phosphate GlcNAc-1-phosphate transferase